MDKIKMQMIGPDYAIKVNNITIRSRSCSEVLALLAGDGLKTAANGFLRLSNDRANTLGPHFCLMALQAITGRSTGGINIVITGGQLAEAVKAGRA